MIRINHQTDYAFRIILYLAKQAPGTRVPSNEIKRNMLVPSALSPRIVAQLARGEFIHTFPGRNGGIQLARHPGDISLWDILELFEGPIYISSCLSEEPEDQCPFDDTCPIHARWGPLQAILRQELEAITFDKLANEAETIALEAKIRIEA